MTEIPTQASYEQQAVEGVGAVGAEGEEWGRKKVEDGLEGSPEQVLLHRNPFNGIVLRPCCRAVLEVHPLPRRRGRGTRWRGTGWRGPPSRGAGWRGTGWRGTCSMLQKLVVL